MPYYFCEIVLIITQFKKCRLGVRYYVKDLELYEVVAIATSATVGPPEGS